VKVSLDHGLRMDRGLAYKVIFSSVCFSVSKWINGIRDEFVACRETLITLHVVMGKMGFDIQKRWDERGVKAARFYSGIWYLGMVCE